MLPRRSLHVGDSSQVCAMGGVLSMGMVSPRSCMGMGIISGYQICCLTNAFGLDGVTSVSRPFQADRCQDPDDTSLTDLAAGSRKD